MSLHTNGTAPDALLRSTGLSADALRGNFERHIARTEERLANPDEIPHPSMMGAAMLLEQRTTPAYAGSVPAATVARRRAANKAARRARAAARKAARA